MSTSLDHLPGIAESDCGTTVVLSYGMGVDSTAILLRWLIEPSSRDFDLADLIVVTADTGGEFDQTITDVEQIVLPALRRHGVRFIQVGRSQRKTTAKGDGVAVLQDTTAPTRLHRAAYTLAMKCSRPEPFRRSAAHVCAPFTPRATVWIRSSPW